MRQTSADKCQPNWIPRLILPLCRYVLISLNAEIFSAIVVSGYESSPAAISTYLAGIELPNARVRRVEVVPISEDYVLLGRDVLNNFVINLNGPELTFDVK
jgi:hypothetical protein